MKKFVFLHGSGGDKNSYADFMRVVAKYFDAELIVFNAPFQHHDYPDKFTWFGKFDNKGRRDAVIDNYMYSLQYIKNKIYELNCDNKDVILFGHSQGGGMAVHIGLEMNLGGVIAVCADLPYNVSYKLLSKTPIYWFEAVNDTLLNENRKKSYKLLSENTNFHYGLLPNSTHKDFEQDFIGLINKIHLR